MQFMIDIAQEDSRGLRLAAHFLNSYADMQDGKLTSVPVPPGPVQFPAPQMPPAPPAFVPPPPPANSATAPAPSAAPNSNPSSIVPVPPPPPPAGSLPMVPPPPGALHGATGMPSASNVAPPAATAPQPPANTAPGGATVPDVFDKAGMPWDARIHQKMKGKKKDGTWKLQKGIDAKLVEHVTQELHARMINSTAAGPPGTSNVPPPPPTAGIPPIPPPGAVPPPPMQEQQAPPAPAAGGAPGFRELVQKITAARNTNPPRLTQEQLASILQQAGVPSLQMLSSMAHLVPHVDSLIDATLAMS